MKNPQEKDAKNTTNKDTHWSNNQAFSINFQEALKFY
jgi:hypothetical protein